jgi:hypothetical protein
LAYDDTQELPALVEDDSMDGSDIDEESDDEEEEEGVTLKTQQLSSLTKAITDVQARTVTGTAFDRSFNGSIDPTLKENDFDDEDESPVTVRTFVTSSGFQTIRTKQSIAH